MGTGAPGSGQSERPGVGDRLVIRVQVALGRRQRAVPDDLPQDAHRDACISHPGQPGVPQIMTPKVLVSRRVTASSQWVALRRTAWRSGRWEAR